jgi:HTH-type transcriptional repressor of NAD biosynthesis genes
MKRGLVFGKFMPLHEGHVALIQFAADRCDELIVSLAYRQDDPIPGSLRFEWLKEQFSANKKIRLECSIDDFDDESLSYADRIPLWREFLLRRFPPLDVLFSSELYGTLLAVEMGIAHVPFDPERQRVNISGTLIRQRPYHYWDFIARPARSYFVKKICFYGPESTGKSTMARRMAELYNTEFVPEVAREVVSSNDFSVDDIIRIGRAQTERVLDKVKSANKLLFCDTDLITTQVYCRHYLKVVPPVLYDLEKQIGYDHYFLFGIDVPWIADGLRDLGHQRKEMFDEFEQELIQRKIPYQLLNGNFEQREGLLKEFIDGLLAG